MENLTQTISNLVAILLGVVGVVGVGFFIYGAYMYPVDPTLPDPTPAPDGGGDGGGDGSG